MTGFDVKAEEYPKDAGEFDGVLITGSLSGVYDGDRWIKRLLHVRNFFRYFLAIVNSHTSRQFVVEAECTC